MKATQNSKSYLINVAVIKLEVTRSTSVWSLLLKFLKFSIGGSYDYAHHS